MRCGSFTHIKTLPRGDSLNVETWRSVAKPSA
jgi:hypothetical protein